MENKIKAIYEILMLQLVRWDILHVDLWPSFLYQQVKPLLQVTRQDEEIQARESALLKAQEKLTQAEQEYTDLDKKHVQVNRPHPHCVACPPQFCL